MQDPGDGQDELGNFCIEAAAVLAQHLVRTLHRADRRLQRAAARVMTESYFNRLAAEGYNRIPVTLETFADLDTPLSIYLKLANGPYTYLLESVQGGERFGRYSIIGLPARRASSSMRIRCWC
jgi:hypothetical protein